MKGFRDTARELSWQARYTRTPDGTWTRRQWRVAWDNAVHSRRMGALQAEQEQSDGLTGEAPDELEEDRAAPKYPDHDRLHENDGVPVASRQTNRDWDIQLPEIPLAYWRDPWKTDHHFETGEDGKVRVVADTPEIAARDKRYHQAAAEWFEQTGYYAAPDGWDTEEQRCEEAEPEADFEAGR